MMDRTKVIELAREAGFQSPRLEDKTDYFMLDRFAALVAAHEREQCALSVKVLAAAEDRAATFDRPVFIPAGCSLVIIASDAIRARGTP